MFNFVQIMSMLSFIYSINNNQTTLKSCKLKDMQLQIKRNQGTKSIN